MNAHGEHQARPNTKRAQIPLHDLATPCGEPSNRKESAMTQDRKRDDKLREEIKQMRRQFTSNGPFGNSAGGRGDTHGDFLARAEQELNRRQEATEAVNREVVMPGDADERVDGPIELGDRVWVANFQASGVV